MDGLTAHKHEATEKRGGYLYTRAGVGPATEPRGRGPERQRDSQGMSIAVLHHQLSGTSPESPDRSFVFSKAEPRMISYSYQCWQRARVCRLHRSFKCLAHHCATATGDSPAKSNASTTRIVERLVHQSGTCRSCPWRVRYETTGGRLCVPDDLKLRAFASALQLGTQNHSAESRRVNNNLSELSGRRGDLHVRLVQIHAYDL